MENNLLREDKKDCLSARKSIRKFLPQMPPKEKIEQAIQNAQRAPSYKNTQPWEVVAVHGDKKENLSEMLLGLLKEEAEPTSDIPTPTGWPPAIQARVDKTMNARHAKMGDKPPRPNANVSRAKQRNFMFFDAPAVLFFYHEKGLSEWSILDTGMFIQSVMLSLCEYGIGSVPQAYLIDYSKQTKEFLQIPDHKRLLLGMSIGYADTSHSLFSLFTEREDLKNIFRWA